MLITCDLLVFPCQVNGVDLVNATHAEAVAALKSAVGVCRLVVSRGAMPPKVCLLHKTTL